MKPIDILLALSVPLNWGLGFSLAKLGLGQFPPLLLMGLRFSIAAALLVWMVRPPIGLMGKIFLIALVSATLQYGLTFNGLKGLDASTAILVVQLEVPFGVLLAVLVLGEPLKARRLAWVAVFAAPQMFVASWAIEQNQWQAITSADWTGWAVVLYLGLVMTGLGYGAWYHLLGRYEVGQVLPYLLLLPVTSVTAGVVLLGEVLTAWTLLGGALVLAGVAAIIIERNPLRA